MESKEIKECNWGKELIAQVARRVSEVAQFDPIQEINFENVVRAFGGKIEDGVNPTTGDSIVVRGKFDFSITLDASATAERKRFTMAHELGHYFLHSKQGSNPLKAYRLGTTLAEQEANFFAANLLMPENEFRKQWASRSTLIESSRIAEVAKVFHVSASAAAARAEYLFGKK